jgi:hypothetical protein
MVGFFNRRDMKVTILVLQSLRSYAIPGFLHANVDVGLVETLEVFMVTNKF